MRKIKLKFLLVWLLVFSWLLAGWPALPEFRIKNSELRIPPRIQEAQAAVALISGGAINGATTNGGNVTLTFPSGVQQDDVVILYGGHPHRASTNLGPQTSGYTAIATYTAAAPNFGAWYKIMGASPDSNVVGYGTGNSADATAYAAYILRGVDSSIFDQTTVTTGPTTSTNPNPASIATQTADAWVLALAGSQVNDASRGTVTNYSNLNGNSGNDSNDISVDGATRQISSPTTENPPAWSSWASGAWYAITIAVKPKPNNSPSLTVSQPDGVSDTVVVGQSYNITYDLSDTEDVATVNFYYDSNSSGLDGTAITGCQDQAEGTGATCSWNTTGMAAGDYYVYGIATDGVNSPVNDYSPGVITIQAAVVSVSVSDGNIVYSFVAAGGAKSTLPGELNDMQTATNDGNVTETFNIKGQDAACPWTLAATAGNNQYIHQFCNDTDYDCTSPPNNYTALTTSYQTLDTGIAQSGTVNFQLRITVPTETSCYTQQSVDVTIQAVQ